MRVQIRNFSVLAYAQGFTHWHYKLGDHKLEDTLSPGYFDTAKDMLSPEGDCILISGKDGAAHICVSVSNTGAVTWSKVQ